MPTKRAILARLSRDELLGVLDAYELDVPDRRVKDQLVEVLAASVQAQLDDILSALRQDRLKELCRGFDFDDSGREKALLVERLTGKSTAARGADDSATEDLALPVSGMLTVDQLERYLWSAADILRGSIDSSDYKSYIFGLLFLKRLSDRFEEEAEKLVAEGLSKAVAWSDPSLLIRDKVLERRQQKGPEPAPTGIGHANGALLEELDEERLGQISGILPRVTPPAHIRIEWVPVGSAERRQGRGGVGRRAVRGGAHHGPPRGLEGAGTTDTR